MSKESSIEVEVFEPRSEAYVRYVAVYALFETILSGIDFSFLGREPAERQLHGRLHVDRARELVAVLKNLWEGVVILGEWSIPEDGLAATLGLVANELKVTGEIGADGHGLLIEAIAAARSAVCRVDLSQGGQSDPCNGAALLSILVSPVGMDLRLAAFLDFSTQYIREMTSFISDAIAVATDYIDGDEMKAILAFAEFGMSLSWALHSKNLDLASELDEMLNAIEDTMSLSFAWEAGLYARFAMRRICHGVAFRLLYWVEKD